MKTRVILLAALVLGLCAHAGGAAAQAGYPERPIRILVGFTAGTAPDVVARMLAEWFGARFGTPAIVEDVTGASGNIACDRVAKAAPDGYTLVMCSNSSLTVAPSLYKSLPYDPLRDLAPITRTFVATNLLVVHPDVPAHSLAELVALARAQPGQLTYAHTGIGTSQHLAGELFKAMAKLDIRPVAYRGTTASMPDLLAGRVTMSFANVVNTVPVVREGKLRAFAVSSIKRSAAVPDLPTMDEMGYPGFEAVPWFGLMGPAGMPGAIVDKLNRETRAMLDAPDMRAKLAALGLDVIGSSPEEFTQAIRAETPRWAKLIREAGIQAND